MAINPETAFVGKIKPASASYPFGEAQDITVPGDGTGTPWNALNLSDIYGMHQALLDAAGAVPSGTPDKVGASQYLNAMQAILASAAGSVSILIGMDLVAGSLVATTGYFSGSTDGAATYKVLTPAQFGGTPDELGDHTMGNGNIAKLIIDGAKVLTRYGTNGTNDEVNLAAALVGGGDLYIPKTTTPYDIASAVTIASSTSIQGENGATLKKSAASTDDFFDIIDGTVNVAIRGLTLDGNATGGATSSAIHFFEGFVNVTVENNIFIDCQSGFFMNDIAATRINLKVINNTFDGTQISSIRMNRCEDALVFGNRITAGAAEITDPFARGIELVQCNRAVIDANKLDCVSTFAGTPRYRDAIFNTSSPFSRITNNFCTQMTDDGITVQASNDVVVTGNVCTFSTTTAGILFLSTVAIPIKRAVISNNICAFNGALGTGDAGIFVSFVEDSLISNNICYQNGDYGIYVLNTAEGNSTDVTIEGNLCVDNANAGVRVENTGRLNIVGNSMVRNGATGANPFGLSIFGGVDIRVSDNLIKDNTSHGIGIFSSTGVGFGDIEILGNRIISNGDEGIRANADRLDIKGSNLIKDNVGRAVHIDSGVDVKVNGNHIRGNGGAEGIRFDGTVDCEASNNTIANNGDSGIFCGTTTNARIADNDIFDDQAVATQLFGVVLSSATETQVLSNHIYNHSLEGVKITDSDGGLINGNQVDSNGRDNATKPNINFVSGNSDFGVLNNRVREGLNVIKASIGLNASDNTNVGLFIANNDLVYPSGTGLNFPSIGAGNTTGAGNRLGDGTFGVGTVN